MPVEILTEQTYSADGLVLMAAEKEMCAFLCTVNEIFGRLALERAAALWIAAFEEIAADDIDAEEGFRRVTIRAAARLTAGACSLWRLDFHGQTPNRQASGSIQASRAWAPGAGLGTCPTKFRPEPLPAELYFKGSREQC